jgi:hypothetical protein
MIQRARALVLTVSASILALGIAYGCGGDDAVNGVGDGGVDAGSDGTFGVPESGTPGGDSSSPAATCTNFADAAAPYESLGTGVIHGADIDGTFCARVKVRSGSYNHQSPSDLVLELAGVRSSFKYTNPTATVGGNLIAYLGLAATSAGVSASTDPGECGNVFAGVLLKPPPTDHHCDEDAGPSSCPSGCFRVCTGDAGCAGIPCEPIPKETGYEAALAGNCLGLITTPQGSWKVTLTALDPTGHSPAYTAHGTLEATLLERGDGGAAGTPATLTVTF